MNSLSVDNPSIPSAEMKVLCKLIKKPKTQGTIRILHSRLYTGILPHL